MKKLLLVPSILALCVVACSGDKDEKGGDGDGDGGATGAGDGDGDGDGDGGTTGDGDGDGDVSSACDLSGVWAVQSKTNTTASTIIGPQKQVANRWFIYEISQSGDEVTIDSITGCAVHVKNNGGASTEVTLSDDALKGLIANEAPVGGEGTFTQAGDSCHLDLGRIYNVLGATPEDYLPADPQSQPELASLKALPTEGDTTGAEDWDGDMAPGLAFDVAAAVSGVRNSVQRSFVEFDSDDSHTIDLNSTSFTVNSKTEIEEEILSAANTFLKTPASLDGTDHPSTFTRLGDTRTSAKFPGGDAVPADDFAACRALESQFPYAQ